MNDPGFGQPSSFADIVNDLFGSFMGGGGRRGPRGPQRGNDLRMALDIDLVEAANGVKKEVKVRRHEVCLECCRHRQQERQADAVRPLQGPRRVHSTAGLLRTAPDVPVVQRRRHGDCRTLHRLPRWRSHTSRAINQRHVFRRARIQACGCSSAAKAMPASPALARRSGTGRARCRASAVQARRL